MVGCSVHFYRRVLGVPFAVAQGTVEIRCARDEGRAIQAAKRRFERRLRIEDWRIRADAFDVGCLHLLATQAGSAPPSGTAREVEREPGNHG